jgi:hypothetical protein
MVKEKEKRSKREKEIGGTISLFIYKAPGAWPGLNG